MKKIFALLLCVTAAFSLCACGTSPASARIGAAYAPKETAEGVVFFLDPAQEDASKWEKLAALYTEETGISVSFMTAEGDYGDALCESMLTMDSPTVFQVRNKAELERVKDYCYDMSREEFCKNLADKEYALSADDAVYGVALNVKTYGLIVNTALLEQAGHNTDELSDFEGLKAVAEDITAKRDVEENAFYGIFPLEFSAFSSAPLSGDDGAEFAAVLANYPLFRQFRSEEGLSTAPIRAELLNNMKSFLELYVNNSVSTAAEMSNKTQQDAIKEFADSKAVFCLGSSDAYTQLAGMDSIRMIPLRMGYEDESEQGLSSGVESYFCINRDSDEENINAALDFFNWLASSENGSSEMARELGYVSPFTTAAETPNIFAKRAQKYIADGRTNVRWCFDDMPSEAWKSELGSALSAFVSGGGKWDAVKELFAGGWTGAFAAAESESGITEVDTPAVSIPENDTSAGVIPADAMTEADMPADDAVVVSGDAGTVN